MKKKSISPFLFERLPRYTAGQVQMLSFLADCFKTKGGGTLIINQMTRMLQKYLGEGLTISYESLFEAPFKQFLSGLPEKFVGLIFSMAPYPQKMIAELDYDFSLVLVDKLLGGIGEINKNKNHVALTSLEEGILQFIFVKALKEFKAQLSSLTYSPKFEKIVTQPQILNSFQEEDHPHILLTFRLSLNSRDGYIRFCLPQGLLQEMALRHVISAPDHLNLFDYMKTVVWAELASVSLSPQEISELQRGDIILFDEAYSSYHEGKISGEVYLRLGDTTTGSIQAHVEGVPEGYQIKIGQVIRE